MTDELPEPLRVTPTLDERAAPAHPLKQPPPQPESLPGHGLLLGPPGRTVVVGRARWWRAVRRLAVGTLVAVALMAAAARAWSPGAMLATAFAVGLLLVVPLRRPRRHLTRVSPTGARGSPGRRRVEVEDMYGIRLQAAWKPGDPAP